MIMKQITKEHIDKLNENSQMAIGWIGHLTEKHQLEAADKLISKLQMQLGQERSYVEELQIEIDTLKKDLLDLEDKHKKEIEQLEGQLKNSKDNFYHLQNNYKEQAKQLKTVLNKYAKDVPNQLSKDTLYSIASSRIKSVMESYNYIKRRNEQLLQIIVNLREKYGENN